MKKSVFFSFVVLLWSVVANAITPITPLAPVELKIVGPVDNNVRIQFEVKINTDKAISQVEIGQKFLDAAAKVVKDTPFVWQNIVNGTEVPIEKGKSYSAKVRLPEGAIKADLKLIRVVYKDGTEWKAP